LVALVWLTGRPDVMGPFINRKLTMVAAACALLIIGLDT